MTAGKPLQVPQQVQGAHFVGARPVGDVINDKALRHEVLRGGVVAAAGRADVALLGAPVVVPRDQLVQNRVWAIAACSQHHLLAQQPSLVRLN